MATAIFQATGPAMALLSLVDNDGSGRADHVRALLSPPAPLRDLSDAVHALCVLHGIFPGFVDQTRSACTETQLTPWLDVAAATIAQERALLSFARPPPSGRCPPRPARRRRRAPSWHCGTRSACSPGRIARAVRPGRLIAFVLDWQAIRGVLDIAASRHATRSDQGFDPLMRRTHALLHRYDPAVGQVRAMMFGAQQLLAQHRGLWHLLEARASARNDR
ncbi:DUF6975 family protein [Sphingomonas sp. MMS24-JH45]